MGYLARAYYSISPTRYYKDDSCWSEDLKSKATKDIISIGNFMEVLGLNHYVLVRKIFVNPKDTSNAVIILVIKSVVAALLNLNNGLSSLLNILTVRFSPTLKKSLCIALRTITGVASRPHLVMLQTFAVLLQVSLSFA
ncbi:hypothetical protein Tco_0106021 [Tanacetum coccineum]